LKIEKNALSFDWKNKKMHYLLIGKIKKFQTSFRKRQRKKGREIATIT